MPSFLDLSFSPAAQPLLEQPGSFAHLPGVRDPHGDWLPRWSDHPQDRAARPLPPPSGRRCPGPCLPDLPLYHCKSSCAHA